MSLGVGHRRQVLLQCQHRVIMYSLASRTSSINKLIVELRGEQGIREVPEKLLHKPCDTVDIVVESLWVGKVNLRRV